MVGKPGGITEKDIETGALIGNDTGLAGIFGARSC